MCYPRAPSHRGRAVPAGRVGPSLSAARKSGARHLGPKVAVPLAGGRQEEESDIPKADRGSHASMLRLPQIEGDCLDAAIWGYEEVDAEPSQTAVFEAEPRLDADPL